MPWIIRYKSILFPRQIQLPWRDGRGREGLPPRHEDGRLPGRLPHGRAWSWSEAQHQWPKLYAFPDWTLTPTAVGLTTRYVAQSRKHNWRRFWLSPFSGVKSSCFNLSQLASIQCWTVFLVLFRADYCSEQSGPVVQCFTRMAPFGCIQHIFTILCIICCCRSQTLHSS